MKIRAHHLLCLAAFEGKGYSKTFIQMMQKVQESLLSNRPLKLVSGTDIICDTCPNVQNIDCSGSSGSAQSRDSKVNLLLNSTLLGNFIEPKNIYLSLSKTDPLRLREVCLGCSWIESGICTISQEKLFEFYKRIKDVACN